MYGIVRLNLKKQPKKIPKGRSVIDSSLRLHLKTLYAAEEGKKYVSRRQLLRESLIYKTIEAKSATFRMSLTKGKSQIKDTRQSNNRGLGIYTSLDRPNLRRSYRIKTLANVYSISLNRANLQAMMNRLKMASVKKKRYASLEDD